MARQPSSIISLPLSQNKGISVKRNLSRRANLTSRLTPSSNRRSSNTQWHDPTCRSNLLHEWLPSKVTHYTYKDNKDNNTNTLADTNLRQQTRTMLGTYHPRQREDHSLTEETKWFARPARPATTPKLLCRPSSQRSIDPRHTT